MSTTEQPAPGVQAVEVDPAVVPGGHPIGSNRLADVSVYLLLLGLAIGPPAFVVAAIMAHVALAQIRRTGESGRSTSLAVVWLGWILAVLGTAATIVVLYYVVFGPFFLIEAVCNGENGNRCDGMGVVRSTA